MDVRSFHPVLEGLAKTIRREKKKRGKTVKGWLGVKAAGGVSRHCWGDAGLD